MVTDEEVRQMEGQLMALRERERALLAELETVQMNIRRQEGAILFAQALQKRQAGVLNGAEPMP